jgi:hypothetical protein
MFLLAVVGQTNAGIDNTPPNPAIGWTLAAAALIGAFGPMIAAKIAARRSRDDANPAPAGTHGSTTPRIDISQQYLEKFVANLERQAAVAEAKYAALEERAEVKYQELERKHFELQRKFAREEAKGEALSHEIQELRVEVNLLRGRLMGHG